MVSVFATEARIVLGQEKVRNKNNDITAIRKLLNIKGHIITIDAMGCQQAIADLIEGQSRQFI